MLILQVVLVSSGTPCISQTFTFISAEDDAIFGASPEEDEFSAFGKSGGLFSTSKGLFDDDADDEVKPCSHVPFVRLGQTPRMGFMATNDDVHIFKNGTAKIKEKTQTQMLRANGHLGVLLGRKKRVLSLRD